MQMNLCWNKRFMVPYITQMEHVPECRHCCFGTFRRRTIISSSTDESDETRVIVLPSCSFRYNKQ